MLLKTLTHSRHNVFSNICSRVVCLVTKPSNLQYGDFGIGYSFASQQGKMCLSKTHKLKREGRRVESGEVTGRREKVEVFRYSRPF